MQSQSKDELPTETSVTDSENSSAEESQINGGSKKRKRPQKISCELCKARKVKCDRQEPACGWCAKNNRVCIYKERKRPGLRASYGIELEDKLNRMEAMLHMLGRRVEDHLSGGPCYPQSETTNQPDTRQLSYQPMPDTFSPHDTPISQASWGQQGPTSYPQPQYMKTNDAMSGQDLMGDQQDSSSDMNQNPSPRLNFDTSQDDELPPADSLYKLIDLYFKHVNTWSPILDRKATFDVLLDLKGPTEADRILLHAIVAVTLRFSKDPRFTPELRQRYHTNSKQKVQLYALEHPSIRAMQALALITIDAHGTSSGMKGWNLLALLARNIIQLGLGVESSIYLKPDPDQPTSCHTRNLTLPQPQSWIEDEGRRRLFWLTYIIDRYATISSHYDFTLDEKETDRPLPCRYDLFSKNQPVETRWFRNPGSTDVILDNPDNLGSFSYHCEVLRILSQIHRFLRRPIDIDSISEVTRWRDTYRELDSKLSTWLAHLPGEYGKISQLCHSDPGSRVSNWIMIHAAFVTSVIRLHSAAAYPTSRSAIFQPSFNAVQRCLAAVESLRAIAQDVLDGGMLDLLGPPFAFALWTSGRLLLVHAATIDSAIDPMVWFLISTLESMGRSWEVARNWASTLTRLVREGQQADDDSRQNRPLSSSKSYNDMRRTAHHLSSLAARKPRSILDPASTRPTSLNELEYLDVFDWFDYPVLLAERDRGVLGTGAVGTFSPVEGGFAGSGGGVMVGSFVAPNPEGDWLGGRQTGEFKPPYE